MKSKWWIGALAALVVLVGGGLAASWAPDRPVESLKARWAAPASGSKFVDVRGMAVHYRDEGVRTDAEPIVLLHGTSASLHTWDGWAAELAKTRRVIRFDLPGFGLTGPFRGDGAGQWMNEDGGRYTPLNYAKFVVATLDALGISQPVVLGGNSLGGQIAWETADYLRATQPARIAKLILVDAAGYPFESKSVPLGFRLARIEGLAPLLENTLPRGLVETSVKNVYGDPSKITPELVDRYYELTLREGNRRALGLRMRERMALAPERIANITQPTLIIWGGQDRLIPPINGERFAKDIAGSKLVKFETLGHVPHEEDAMQTVAAVQAFLAGK
ncbi:alpha/beta hydrolase [Variovorax sp. PCZ-1]|uniref:alpha/beta fold hydrolase n=1 Tax=Variovorax sp. PCZ-1 TaxID=2835533 RepID=UPI001BCE4CD0|nr:alpha/beta hydrolase [Variovorax sp. PCZ-1]MBS7808741.1 alpha/beta hydrolase [Variovorax sp. PCZ-1]